MFPFPLRSLGMPFIELPWRNIGSFMDFGYVRQTQILLSHRCFHMGWQASRTAVVSGFGGLWTNNIVKAFVFTSASTGCKFVCILCCSSENMLKISLQTIASQVLSPWKRFMAVTGRIFGISAPCPTVIMTSKGVGNYTQQILSDAICIIFAGPYSKTETFGKIFYNFTA